MKTLNVSFLACNIPLTFSKGPMKNHFDERCNTSSIKNPTTLLPTEPDTEMGSHEEEDGVEMSMTIFGIRGIRKTPAIWFIIFISVLLLFFFCTTTAKKQEYNDV